MSHDECTNETRSAQFNENDNYRDYPLLRNRSDRNTESEVGTIRQDSGNLNSNFRHIERPLHRDRYVKPHVRINDNYETFCPTSNMQHTIQPVHDPSQCQDQNHLYMNTPHIRQGCYDFYPEQEVYDNPFRPMITRPSTQFTGPSPSIFIPHDRLNPQLNHSSPIRKKRNRMYLTERRPNGLIILFTLNK